MAIPGSDYRNIFQKTFDVGSSSIRSRLKEMQKSLPEFAVKAETQEKMVIVAVATFFIETYHVIGRPDADELTTALYNRLDWLYTDNIKPKNKPSSTRSIITEEMLQDCTQREITRWWQEDAEPDTLNVDGDTIIPRIAERLKHESYEELERHAPGATDLEPRVSDYVNANTQLLQFLI